MPDSSEKPQHLSWGNMLVSIAGGTVVYMLPVQLVF